MVHNTEIDPELERGYNISLLRADFPAVIDDWLARSQTFRDVADAQLNLVYGEDEHERADLFSSGNKNAPLLVFIHGGYWQRGDKNWNSFVAEPFVEAGVDVVLIGYTLCPQTDIASIGAQVRKAMLWIWQNAARLGISSERINLCGHSAGGHLTALMLATDWQQVADNAPIDLIKSGIPISGLYQLEPLRQTSLNNALGMDANYAYENSPQFMRPASMAPVLTILGAAETGQFHWQMEQFVQKWQGLGVEVGTHLEPGVDHYDVINRLAQADSAIFRRVYDWLQ